MSSSAASSQPRKNYSILSIPVAFGLVMPPHLYFFGRAMIASGYTYTNALPRTNLETLKGTIAQSTYNSLVRARGAHINGLENFPLFAGAMIAGNYAKLSPGDLNFAAAEYIGARVVYTALYMTTTSEALSYVRSGAYFWSLAAPLWILWKAGTKIRDEGVEKKSL